MKRSIPPVPSLVHFHFEARFIPEAIRAEKDCKQGPDSHKNLCKGRGSALAGFLGGKTSLKKFSLPKTASHHLKEHPL